MVDLEQALALAIEEQPDDDAGWLVLADWLDDRGDGDRAEVVRLLVQLRHDLDVTERGPREERLRALLNAGVRPWMPRRRLTLRTGVDLELVLIPPGHFVQGSPAREAGREPCEGPMHVVTLTRPFWLGVVPVTQAQWQAVMGDNPSRFVGESRPVEQLSWDAATDFCDRLSERFGAAVRLPTEAEWEYACRAGTTTPYSSGDGMEALRRVGWCNYEAQVYTAGETQPVGLLAPNAFGLHDMHGNVWEWCADWFGPYPAAEVVDPRGAKDGPGRVVRGGSWYFAARISRSAYRYYYPPHTRTDSHGLRVVVEWRG